VTPFESFKQGEKKFLNYYRVRRNEVILNNNGSQIVIISGEFCMGQLIPVFFIPHSRQSLAFASCG